MAEEQPKAPSQEPAQGQEGDRGNAGSPPQRSDGSGQQQQQPGPVPYERFKAVNDQLVQMRAEVAKIQDEQKKAAEKELADQQKWEQLYKQRESELQAERAARTRLEIATRKGLPVDLATRLQGETAEEIEADADALLKFLKPATGPGVPPSGGGTPPRAINLDTMSPAEIRKLTPQQKQAAMQG